ncbi:MAG TPA: NAD-dependent epimerase/dehydratase family protein [Candidatus Baltobacteraceae bacterium]|nr:NAD-dependent epimerase/dehydratase family protein [Candidatus Baltobacteraceae bacterium]
MADTVFLTGSSGFVGAHVLRELLAAGYDVKALVRKRNGADAPCHGDPSMPQGRASSNHGRGIEAQVQYVEGDLADVGTWAHALDGCRYVVHCAALYSFAPRDRALMHRVNVVGTASLMEAARVAGVERVVHTSSSATLGASVDGTPRTENDFAPEGRSDGYHHSKVEQERAAFAGRVPVIALLPTAPVGPGDWKPTPTGLMILDFARGKMFAKPPRGGLNVVPVEDVARAHVAALRNGTPGERYILGGENLLLDDVWQLLSEVAGKPMPHWRVPDAVALAIATVDEMRCRVQKNAQPFVPLEGVRMARERMFADSAKAARELGFHAGPVREALERAVQWYVAHGYVRS